MIRTTVICDNCGAEKKETNHWWTGWELHGMFHVAPFRRDGTLHLCGERCVIAKMSEYMHGEQPAAGEVRP